jgi:hypothetical protein
VRGTVAHSVVFLFCIHALLCFFFFQSLSLPLDAARTGMSFGSYTPVPSFVEKQLADKTAELDNLKNQFDRLKAEMKIEQDRNEFLHKKLSDAYVQLGSMHSEHSRKRSRVEDNTSASAGDRDE